MVWGFLTPAHIISLVAGVGIIIGMYFALRNLSEKAKIIILGILSFSGIAAIIFNLLMWNSPLEYLPLHLCSLNALVLPIAVFTRNKTLNNLLLLWSFWALFSLLVNVSVADAKIFDPVFCFFYFPHVLELGIPILMFVLKLVKKDVKCIVSTIVITFSTYTLIHFINLWINNYTATNNILDWSGNVIKVNYMFSITPENPLLALFYSIIPFEYWYMYLAVIPIAIYLGFVYLKDIIKLVHNRRTK